MTKDSTSQNDIDMTSELQNKSPRRTTIAFIRQFAASYTKIQGTSFNTLMMN